MTDNNCNKRGWWTQYSESRLIEVETTILSAIKSTFHTWFVSIGSVVGQNDKIWTISLNRESKNTPLVLLHGFAAGIGFWCKNFDEIAKDRPVYAIDLLGFGRSSRPYFAKNCETAEKQWVSAIEEWRKEVKLEHFILLGHSFGGYLATSYAIQHPERVKHLILADPWGLGDKSSNITLTRRHKFYLFFFYPLILLNPLSTVRAAGPLGPRLVRKMRGDIARRYQDTFDDTDIISEYIYQCNSQYPSGESAFQTFLKGVAGTKNPMMHRFDSIHESIPITVIYGEKSWIDRTPGLILQEKRQNISYVNVNIVPNAGHHIYSDEPGIFNQFVRETCQLTDSGNDQKNSIKIIDNNIPSSENEIIIIDEVNNEPEEMEEDPDVSVENNCVQMLTPSLDPINTLQ